jgi:hypothetical protein
MEDERSIALSYVRDAQPLPARNPYDIVRIAPEMPIARQLS